MLRWTFLWALFTCFGFSAAAADTPSTTPSWLFVSHLKDRKIVTYRRDVETGELARVASTACPAEPAIMAVSPRGGTLFVSFRSSGRLASFRVDPHRGSLTLLSVAVGGADPAYLRLDRTGRFLLTAYYVADKVTVHRVDEHGRLAVEPLQTVPTAPRAHGIAIDSRNELVFVTHTGANRIYGFRFDADTGRLAPGRTPFITAAPGAEPRHIVLHPSDRWAYANNEAGDSVSVYAVDRKNVLLQHLQTLPTIPASFEGSRNTTARCEMTHDGRFLYVANRGHDSLAAFAIDPHEGTLHALGQTPTEKVPRSFTITPDGKFLYAAGEANARIAHYAIEENGRLKRVATYNVAPIPWCVLAVD